MPRCAGRNLRAIALVACGIITLTASSLHGEDKRPIDPARDAIVQRLTQQDKLVKSCECLLSYRSDPTDPKMILLIEAHCRKTGARPAQYVVKKELAARFTYVAHWWRSGPKERYDQFRNFEEMAQPGAKPTLVQAFDGAIVRRYNVHDRPNPANGAMVEGGIYRVDQLWSSMYPFTFLYEYDRSRYSDLLARSPDVKVSERAGRTTVAFAHPTSKSNRFVLMFDRDGSLLQRDIVSKHPRDAAPRIYERQSFSGYRTYRSASGASVRFPSEADYDGVLGTTDDGRLIVYNHRHIQVNSFQFNHPIADEVFRIQFPDGCPVYDGVNRRWLDREP